MKHLSFLFLTTLFLVTTTHAQEKCGATIMLNKHKAMNPQIAEYEAQLRKQYQEAVNAIFTKNALAKITTPDSFIYDIPVVVHIIHNYGPELLPDDSIYNMIKEMNAIYSLNYDYSAVIPPFQKYVGKANIRFHLATIDPLGFPTKGITHHYSYLTYGGDDQAKMDLWPPDHYYNIFIENRIGLGIAGGEVLAYAEFPSTAAAYPFIDGVISGYIFVNPNPYGPLTIEHETGHYFNLLHTWNDNGAGMGACGVACGDDEVDDTPPTKGHPSTCPLYDTECATGYVKYYPSGPGGTQDSIVNYPDTTNVQNIMDYATCPLMFTNLQVLRMHTALNSPTGSRDSLWTPHNLAITGALAPIPDLPPIPDFSVNNHFVCENGSVTFTDHSWNDTITHVAWTFPSYAAATTSVASKVANTFSEPGWVKVSLAATGNNTSTVTRTDSTSLFVADKNPTPAINYVQEFDAAQNGNDLAKWPMFNYYNNGFKWTLNTQTGYYDHACMQYTGFDSRTFPATATGSPVGDLDDFFTPVFDLTGLQNGPGPVSINFMYSATAATANANEMHDTLEIDYTANCGNSWLNVAYLTQATLINQGLYTSAYEPLWQGLWSLQSIALPANAITSGTIFRFRYKPHTITAIADEPGFAVTSNNFFMDRLNFSNDPLGLNTLLTSNNHIAVAPNPTNGDAFVVISATQNTSAQISVTDISGRVVYSTETELTGQISRIMIPKELISVKGIYLVHVVAGADSKTEKLVVY